MRASFRSAILTAMLMAGGLLPAVPAGADCGPAPITSSYSTNFYRAQRHFACTKFCQSTGGSVNATFPVEGIPIGGGASYSNQTCSELCQSDDLTEQQATQFIQQEHADRGAQIVDECAYRMCTFLQQGVSETLKTLAITMQATICQHWLTPDGQTPGHSSEITFSETAIPLTFIVGSDQVTERLITIRNDDDATKKFLLFVDQGPAGVPAGANALVTVRKFGSNSLKPITKLTVKGFSSVTVKLVVSAPASIGETYMPQLVVQNAKDAGKRNRVQFLLRKRDPNAEIPPGFRICDESEPCSGIPYLCSSVGDDSDGFQGGMLIANVNAGEIIFGEWVNPQCGTSGSGWHTGWGSCGSGQGNGFKRCRKVLVYEP